MLRKLHLALIARPGWVVALALISCVPTAWYSAQLFSDLRADLRELLPEGARSVATLREIERRFGGFSQLSIVVRSPDPATNRAFSDALTAEILRVPGVRSARNKVGPEKKFFQERWQLYVDLEDLEIVRDRIDAAATEARKAANPLFVDIESDTSTAPKGLDFSDITEKYAAKRAAAEQFPNDYFESPDGTMLAVIVRRRGLAFSLAENEALVADVQAAIAKLNPGQHEGMVVGLGGDVKNLLEEQESLIEDLIAATLIVTFLLALLVVGYYRRWRAMLLILFPLLVGTLWTFAISFFIVGYLNSSSAFLAAIVPGNGINFGLIMLARYIEERRAEQSIDGALHSAVSHTAEATITAAIAASIAYGSLMATDFLGFKHFGIIGGLGMVVCWIATFAISPSLILLTERRSPINPKDELRLLLPAPGTLSRVPAHIVAAWPRAFSWAGIIATIAGFAITAKFLEDPFEKDFNQLRNTQSLESGAGYWEAQVDAIFGRYLAPQLILADKVEDVAEITAALQQVIAEGGERSPISDVTSISTLVPDGQEEKLEVLDEIRDILTDDVIASLDDEQADLARQYRPKADLEAFTVKDLPEIVRADLRELDGTEGRAVLVMPNLKLNLYHADEIKRVGEVLRSIRLGDGRVVESSGSFVVYTDMLDTVSIDGPKATVYSFLGVLLLCAIVFRRPRRVVIVAGSLLAGVALMGAFLAITGLKLNFLNFIGLPITFGIGVDYAVNIFSRGLLEDQGHEARQATINAIVRTGGAVVLCSLTTIIGYGSLLVANNGALISFGKVAILGEFTCLAAALFFLPAWMIMWPAQRPVAEAKRATHPDSA